MKTQANERTFQGILLNTIAEIITENKELNFSQITQEENIGVGKQSRFADGLLYSALDISKKTLIEVVGFNKNINDTEILENAMYKASASGIEYLILISTFEIHLYKTFIKFLNIYERILEKNIIIDKNNILDIFSNNYKTILKSKLKTFFENNYKTLS